MRINEFRAWDKVNGEMIPWSRLLNGYNLRNVFMRPEMCGLILMQFTGLKDKNGVEIFEGDLVRFTNSIDEVDDEVGKVIWEQSECNFVAQYKTTNRATQKENGTTKTIYLISNEIYRKDVEYEVIGNIYENSDLFEEEE